MPRTIACACGSSYEVPDSASGASARCIWCGNWNPVPASGEPPSTPAQTPCPSEVPRQPSPPEVTPADTSSLPEVEVFPARRLVRGVLGCLLVPTVGLAVGVAWGFAQKHETEAAWGFGVVLGIISLALLQEFLRASGALKISSVGIEEHTPISVRNHAWVDIGAIVYTESIQHGGHGAMAVGWKCRIYGHDERKLQTFRSTYDRPAFASLVRRAEALGYGRTDQPPPLLEIRLEAPNRPRRPSGADDRR